ncbi:ADP-ribosylglycohydrolase family protein [Lysobacter sp. BMK333-48F3]|uniref:ADP-ribosylglycohydrolase family protein n=1 Tax=Lysobacter sp. BMK333-48F3 TaxID=2867962 RepID=UPI001C8C9236|nr:ADP-ribosylglycohydrolase family protein [Lysobacter sp. BMK333-48F3]MBX9400480.1 ADP-ribosylglycohydrolase family protein [Lysobacter sp. BMK333-48F3]
MSAQRADMRERYLGCLLGLACGDAVGTTVEFSPRGSFAPLRDMIGGGPFRLQAGQWTDDTSMALCLGASLIHCRGFDARDQMNRYCNWRAHGYLSSTGDCFDIGMTVGAALDRYLREGDPYAGDPGSRAAGNGALMRLAPVPMAYRADAQACLHYAAESTRTTHGAAEALDASRLFAMQLRAALLGAGKEAVLTPAMAAPQSPSIAALHARDYAGKREDEIAGTGYSVHSLEAALWCFLHTDDYASAVLRAANLGDDADTTAAICGQLAGAYYGVGAIPAAWRERLAMREEIEAMALGLLALAEAPAAG